MFSFVGLAKFFMSRKLFLVNFARDYNWLPYVFEWVSQKRSLVPCIWGCCPGRMSMSRCLFDPEWPPVTLFFDLENPEDKILIAPPRLIGKTPLVDPAYLSSSFPPFPPLFPKSSSYSLSPADFVFTSSSALRDTSHHSIVGGIVRSKLAKHPLILWWAAIFLSAEVLRSGTVMRIRVGT